MKIVGIVLLLVCARSAVVRADEVRLQAIIHGVPMEGEVDLDTVRQSWTARLWTEEAGRVRARLEVGGGYFREADGSPTFDTPYGKAQMRVRPEADKTYTFLSSNTDVVLAEIRERVLSVSTTTTTNETRTQTSTTSAGTTTTRVR